MSQYLLLAVRMEIEDILDVCGLVQVFEVGRYDGNFVRLLLVLVCPFSVDVVPAEVGPRETVDHPIWVGHRNNVDVVGVQQE